MKLRVNAQGARLARQRLLQGRARFVQPARGNQEAHVVKAGFVIGRVLRQRIGQLGQGGGRVARFKQRVGFLHAALGGHGAFAGHVLVQKLAHLPGRQRAGKAIHRLAALEQDACGQAANAKGCGQLLLPV